MMNLTQSAVLWAYSSSLAVLWNEERFTDRPHELAGKGTTYDSWDLDAVIDLTSRIQVITAWKIYFVLQVSYGPYRITGKAFYINVCCFSLRSRPSNVNF
jgi:hypothetical protein